MTTLCQIFEIFNEKEFLEFLEKHGFPSDDKGGWGKFKGEVPAINTTLQLNFDDEKEKTLRQSEYFRVIHHHLVLNHKPIYYENTPEAEKECLEQGDMEIEEYYVYVIKITPPQT